MATLSISKAFSDLFTAPLRAVVDAEKAYLEMWITRLKVIQQTYVSGKGANRSMVNGADLGTLLEQYVPVISLEGRIDTALTMRIAGVKETSGGLSAGLALGPIHASGSFGFVSRNTQESTFQASTSFALANKSFSLTDYLSAANLKMTDPKDLDAAIAHLEKDLASRPSESKGDAPVSTQ